MITGCLVRNTRCIAASTAWPISANSGPRWSMVGISIARSTRSGTLVGPGICRKCLPVCTVMSVLPGLVLASRAARIPLFGGLVPLRAGAVNALEAELCRGKRHRHEVGHDQVSPTKSPFYSTVLNRRRELGLRWPHKLSGAADHLVDDRPEQQHDRKRRDRADQAVRPEHLHVAAGADHRQPERVLGGCQAPTPA